MRREEAVQALLPGRDKWELTRFTFAATGLEMLACVLRKSSGEAETKAHRLVRL